MTNRQLKLAQNAQKAVNKTSSEPADDVDWKHPDELIYSTGSYWTNKKLIHYCIANALSVHPHPDFKDLCFVSDGKKTVIVSDKYRIPIIFASQWQWSKLKGILSAEGKEGKAKWSDEKFEVLHIARVWKILTDEGPSSFELEYYDKEQKSEDIKAWRCPTLDRVLTRFRMGCFSSEPSRVEKFWVEYQESEYSKDVVDFDWRRWLLVARDGVILYEASLSKGLNPEVLMRGLVERDGAWFWPKDSDSTPAGTPAWSLRQTAGDLFARPTKKPSTDVLQASKPDSARKVRSSTSAPHNKSSSSLAASVAFTSTLWSSSCGSASTSSLQMPSLSTRPRRRRPRDSWNPPSDPPPTPSLRQSTRPSVANDDAASTAPKPSPVSQSPDVTAEPAERKVNPRMSSASLASVASESTLSDVASTSAPTSSTQKPSPSEVHQPTRFTPYPKVNPYRKPQPPPPLRKSTRPSVINGTASSMTPKSIPVSESVNTTEREAIPSIKNPTKSPDQVRTSARGLEKVNSQSSPVPSPAQTHNSASAQPLASIPASTPASTPASRGSQSLQSNGKAQSDLLNASVPRIQKPTTSSDQVRTSAQVLEKVKSQALPVPSPAKSSKSAPAQPLASTIASIPASIPASTPASTPTSQGAPTQSNSEAQSVLPNTNAPRIQKPATSSDQVLTSAQVLAKVKSQASPVPSPAKSPKSSTAQPLASIIASIPASTSTPTSQGAPTQSNSKALSDLPNTNAPRIQKPATSSDQVPWEKVKSQAAPVLSPAKSHKSSPAQPLAPTPAPTPASHGTPSLQSNNAKLSSANNSRPGSASAVPLVTATSTTKDPPPVSSQSNTTTATLASPYKAPTAPSNIPKDPKDSINRIVGEANPHLQRGLKRSASPLDKPGPSKHHHSDTQSHNSPSAPPKPTSSPENSISTSPTLAPTSPSTDIAPALTPTAHAPPSTPEALSARGMNVDRKSMDITVPPRETITSKDRWNTYHSDYDKAKSLQILSSPDSGFFTPAPSSTPTPIGSSYTLPHSLMRHMPLEHLLQVDENHRSQKMDVEDVLADSASDLTGHSGGGGMNNDGRDAGRSAVDESTAGNSTRSQSLGISAFFRYPLAHLLGEASA